VSARTLFLALDACDPDVATALAGSGRMPTLARLLADAATVPTLAPPAGTYVSGVWPTLFTASGPEHHGYTCWRLLDPSTYDYRETSPLEIAGAPFWDHLSAAGLRSALIDVPHSWPSRDHDGVMLCEWDSHDRHLGVQSWPPDEARRVTARYGRTPVGGVDHDRVRQFSPCDWVHGSQERARTAEETARLYEDLVRGIETKTAASLDYLDEDSWDLFVSVVSQTHCAGHQLWHLHDPSHPRFEPTQGSPTDDPLADIYARADAFLGAHLAAVDPDTNVFVLLSHGMGSYLGGGQLFDAVLDRLAADYAKPFGRSRGATRAAKHAWTHLPARARTATAGAAGRLAARRPASKIEALDEPPDRSQRPWYAFPNNDPVAAVRFNVVGREARGVIDPSDVDAAADYLTTALAEIVDPGTGEPVVQNVIRARDIFHAPRHPDHFGDLYVEWRTFVETVYSPRVGVVWRQSRNVRSGDHRPGGLLLVTGPAVSDRTAASAPVFDVSPMAIEDVAPTVLATLGVELPGAVGRARGAFAHPLVA
jgi:predicted AlkP superfamily phosphohydrolase/phosphomutase